MTQLHGFVLFRRALALAGFLAFSLAFASAAFSAGIPLTSVAGWPNGRVSNDTPPNAIDGNISTFTWVTESFSTAVPSYLGVGFDSTGVGRIRLWKTPESGGGSGESIKNLIIQYTTDSTATPLSSRTWQTVTGLISGDGIGGELFNATSVNLDGTVTGDVHDSPGGNGWGSLSFDTVVATGIRIGFNNPSESGFEHYRVGEFEVYAAEVPEPGTLALLAVGAACLYALRRRTSI